MNEEKDRYGDFISLLERAREDDYFAGKEREVLEKLKRRLEEAQLDKVKLHNMNCPRCGISLDQSSLLDFAVSRCSECGGIWISHRALQQFLNMKKIEMDANSWSKHPLVQLWTDEQRQTTR
jgi:Zn-finger nucleic acid-binding protein